MGKQKSKYIGAHISSSNYITFENEVKRVKKYGGNIVQIFIPKYDEINKFKKVIDDQKIHIVIHSSYLHNIANEWDTDSWWINDIISEIKRAGILKAVGVVIHLGKQKQLPTHKALNNMFTAIMYIHNKTISDSNVKIIIETSTGQGTEMCYELHQLSYFYKKLNKIHNRVKICVDTCHIFAAGYDLRKSSDVALYLEAFEELIGIKNICLIHLNDCKVKLGEKKDRHESIGKGNIGYKGLKKFYKYFSNLNIPVILETPGDSYITEIRLLSK